MTIDMTNNRVPYGLLTDEEKTVLYEHWRKCGEFERRWPHGLGDAYWEVCAIVGGPSEYVYRTVPLPKTQDVIAWEKLPDWVEWVARGEDFEVLGHSFEPNISRDSTWRGHGERRRIDDFPGIVQIGTCDWKDSKQRRPQVRDGGQNE
jgi:hypothetical protein